MILTAITDKTNFSWLLFIGTFSDNNAFIALSAGHHSNHEAVLVWFVRSLKSFWGYCWSCENGSRLRICTISSGPRYFQVAQRWNDSLLLSTSCWTIQSVCSNSVCLWQLEHRDSWRTGPLTVSQRTAAPPDPSLCRHRHHHQQPWDKEKESWDTYTEQHQRHVCSSHDDDIIHETHAVSLGEVDWF